MDTSTGRFTTAAGAAQTATPQGISRSEGRYRLGLFVAQAALLAFIWQCPQRGWGIAMAAAQFVWILLIITLSRAAARRSGVLPRGFRRAYGWAAAWSLLVVVVGGWLWQVEKIPTAWPITTLVSFLGALPLIWVNARLARNGR